MTEEEIINKFPSPHVAGERTGLYEDFHVSRKFALIQKFLFAEPDTEP